LRAAAATDFERTGEARASLPVLTGDAANRRRTQSPASVPGFFLISFFAHFSLIVSHPDEWWFSANPGTVTFVTSRLRDKKELDRKEFIRIKFCT
jgi:hypothetical protein